MADDRGSASTVVLAFLSGAAVGALAALLLAPEPGPISRDRLRRYVRRAEDNLKDFAGRAGEVYEEAVGRGREFIESKKSAFREAFEAGREAMRRELEHRQREGSRET
ncbi:MAG: YtxH domain-containing protein [Nitrospira sp.]|nr:YtxH domain-containing protein [Nitrospira sp.]MCP9442443.1 YtxH domain-containing protein [Nitrospira sp.]